MPSLSRPTSVMGRIRAAWAISMSDLGCLCCSLIGVLWLSSDQQLDARRRAAQDAALRHDRTHGYIMGLWMDRLEMRELVSHADREGLDGEAREGPIVVSAAVAQSV